MLQTDHYNQDCELICVVTLRPFIKPKSSARRRFGCSSWLSPKGNPTTGRERAPRSRHVRDFTLSTSSHRNDVPHSFSRCSTRWVARTLGSPSSLYRLILYNSQAFSSSRPSASDLAKLILIGRLGKTPETRTTRTDKEYVTWVLGRGLTVSPVCSPMA